ncbi:MAG: M43 family zinc metalloprotease [Chryseobacterium sp.]|uniref:M43 family zinc metalloprotease n=1 Tax=Chryseobacterium sp. TaxID=1871047 RepID=UPI0025BA3823|nr:M43 family zinc metalloprotease [Chryseobacterium sp.]MCJ7932251.1 M43 family zinc metalloprotease [Chryseobacterium sp.]
MNKLYLSLISSFVALSSFQSLAAQRRHINLFGKNYPEQDIPRYGKDIICASSEYEDYLKRTYPERASVEDFEKWMAVKLKEGRQQKSYNNGIITIPVVVHVLHSGQPIGTGPNISDNQILSQITVLNQDFRRMSGTPGWNTSSVGGDALIQFALAKVDPKGNPTNGIDRVKYCDYDFGEVPTRVKPETVWNPEKYMNVWIFDTAGIGAFAQFPSTSDIPGIPSYVGEAVTDGITVDYTLFGSADYDDGTFHLKNNDVRGRTATHEVGHFLGLRHIWGDNFCSTDFCDDTPVHYMSNYGCPTHPKPNSCGSSDEMFENYMDYTSDACKNIFTQDQIARMAVVLNNSPRRAGLKSSVADQAIPLFANDAELKIERSCNTNTAQSCTPYYLEFSLYNRGTANLTSADISYTVSGGSTQTYHWTGSVLPGQSDTFSVPVPAGAAAGNVFAYITEVNNVTDQRSSNNTAIGRYIPPVNVQSYGFSSVKLQLQLDMYPFETDWQLTNSTGTVLYSGGPYSNNSMGLITEIWNLNPDECYIFTINDKAGNGICCGFGEGKITLKSADDSVIIYHWIGKFNHTQSIAFKLDSQLSTKETEKPKLQIFPIPATDILSISNVSDNTDFIITNEAGQMISSGKIRNNMIPIAQLTPGNYILSILGKDSRIHLKFIKK